MNCNISPVRPDSMNKSSEIFASRASRLSSLTPPGRFSYQQMCALSRTNQRSICWVCANCGTCIDFTELVVDWIQ